jgi:serine/threonine protein kinase
MGQTVGRDLFTKSPSNAADVKSAENPKLDENELDEAAKRVFEWLDQKKQGSLTLREVRNTVPGLYLPHSLPALYYFDEEMDGSFDFGEIVKLLRYCRKQKKRVKKQLRKDPEKVSVLRRAIDEGILSGKNALCASEVRKITSCSKYRCVYKTRKNGQGSTDKESSEVGELPPRSDSVSPVGDKALKRSDSLVSETNAAIEAAAVVMSSELAEAEPSCSKLDLPNGLEGQQQGEGRTQSVSMFGSQREFSFQSTSDILKQENECPRLDTDSSAPVAAQLDTTPLLSCLGEELSSAALNAAMAERMIQDCIANLANQLHDSAHRDKYMEWLWKLTNCDKKDVISLEELHLLLDALEEDGINIKELMFSDSGDPKDPVDKRIMDEYNTTHTGYLSREEFMVLADLVVREYENWQARHVEIIGDYELNHVLGYGSQGVVRCATKIATGERFAAKLVKRGKCSDLSRLDREIHVMTMLDHPNIVRLEEVIESDDNLYLIMELCGGGSLFSKRSSRSGYVNPLDEDTARFYVRQLFEGLAYCHERGVAHRDLRLDNLMLDNDGNLKITDFGHAGVFKKGWDLFSTTLVGSLYHLSPEQIKGVCYSGEKIDIWSSGVVVYCLLVGQPPFRANDVSELLNDIVQGNYEMPENLSPEAQELIRSLLQVEPEKRPTCRDVLNMRWFHVGPEKRLILDVFEMPLPESWRSLSTLEIQEKAMRLLKDLDIHQHPADLAYNRKLCRGQEWSLKCYYPHDGLKFYVSLFTRPPISPVSSAAGSENSEMDSAALLKELCLDGYSAEVELGQNALLNSQDSPGSVDGVADDIAANVLNSTQESTRNKDKVPCYDRDFESVCEPFIEFRHRDGSCQRFSEVVRQFEKIAFEGVNNNLV